MTYFSYFSFLILFFPILHVSKHFVSSFFSIFGALGFVTACGLFLVVVSRVYSPVVVHGLLIEVASLVAPEHGL